MPQSHNKIVAHLQYPGVNGPVADLHLRTWLQSKASFISPNIGNGHRLFALTPPQTEDVVTQLDLEYHFTHASKAAFDLDEDEIRSAIYVATTSPFVEGMGDSSWATEPE